MEKPLVVKVQEGVNKESACYQPRLELFGDGRKVCEQKYLDTYLMLFNVSNVLLNVADLLLDHVFDRVDFSRMRPPSSAYW